MSVCKHTTIDTRTIDNETMKEIKGKLPIDDRLAIIVLAQNPIDGSITVVKSEKEFNDSLESDENGNPRKVQVRSITPAAFLTARGSCIVSYTIGGDSYTFVYPQEICEALKRDQ